jgi:hypothetical protein
MANWRRHIITGPIAGVEAKVQQTVGHAVTDLIRDFGGAALAEAERRLEEATAARNYRAGIIWAEICIRLRRC